MTDYSTSIPPVYFNAGAQGYVLTSTGTGLTPSWQPQGDTPIGSITAWLKSYTNTPALASSWVECNGQTLSDAESVFDGQVIPDLNSTLYFLRGNTTSGSLTGSLTHAHSGTTSTAPADETTGSGSLDGTGPHSHTFTTNSGSSLPPAYDVVWIIKIK